MSMGRLVVLAVAAACAAQLADAAGSTTRKRQEKSQRSIVAPTTSVSLTTAAAKVQPPQAAPLQSTSVVEVQGTRVAPREITKITKLDEDPEDVALAVVDVMQEEMAEEHPASEKAETPRDESTSFLRKVMGAALQGATAAVIGAILSACTEPLVNRLLVKRMTFAQAFAEMNFGMVSGFFMTTFPTNMLKFPAFEVINMAMMFTTISGGLKGVVTGWLFCTIMLPVTNYRFRKSMGWAITASDLYQAYIPTVVRDIIYGWARGTVHGALGSHMQPQTHLAKALVFGLTVWSACIISSPGNEWRGYWLQPKERTLPFMEYFKPINYVRSTGVGATIMGLSLMMGNLVTVYVEALVHQQPRAFGTALAACLVLTVLWKVVARMRAGMRAKASADSAIGMASLTEGATKGGARDHV